MSAFFCYFPLFRMISAAITPGIQPARVSRKTMRNEPQPLSTTDNGGKMIASITLSSDIIFSYKIKHSFTASKPDDLRISLQLRKFIYHMLVIRNFCQKFETSGFIINFCNKVL